MSTRNFSRQAYSETPVNRINSFEPHQRRYRRGGVLGGIEDRREDDFQSETSSLRESSFKFPNRPVSPTGTLISVRSSTSSKPSHRSSRSSHSSNSNLSRASTQRSFLSHQSTPSENSDDEDDVNFRFTKRENLRNFKPSTVSVEDSQFDFDAVSEASSAIKSERSYKSYRSTSSVVDNRIPSSRKSGNKIYGEGSIYSNFRSRFNSTRSTQSSQPDEECTPRFGRGMEESPLSSAFILGLKLDGSKPFNLAERLRRSEKSSSSASSIRSTKSNKSRHRKHRYSKGFSDSDSDSTDTASDFDSDSTISSLSSSFSSSGSETETENTPRKRGSSPPVISKPPPQISTPSPVTTASSVPATPSVGRTRARRVWKDGIPPPPSAATIASWTTPGSNSLESPKPSEPEPIKPISPRSIPAYFTTPHYLIQRQRDISLLRYTLLQSHVSTDMALRSQLPEVYEFFIPDQEVWFFMREIVGGKGGKIGFEDCWEGFERVVRMGMEVEDLKGGARDAWKEIEGRRKVKWSERK